MREGIKRNKQFYYKDVSDQLQNGVMTPDEIAYFTSGKVQATVKQVLKPRAKL